MARILACLALAAWLLLLWPFPATTFLAVCAAFVSYPLFRRLRRNLSPRWSVAAYTIFLVVVTLLPIAVVVSLVTPQAVAGLKILDALRSSGWLHSPEAQAWFASLDEWLKPLPGLEGGLAQIAHTAAGLAETAVRTVLSGGVGLAGSALQAILLVFLFLMFTLICVLRADVIHYFTCRITRFPRPVIARFTTTIRKAIFSVLIGVIFVAMIQGFLCGAGFAVAGVPQPAFWGLLAAFVAPVPFVGTALVWLPACLWLWITGSTATCVGLALWCASALIGVDNVLRPFLLKTGIDAPVLALLLSILCGLAAFGAVGILAGPILLAFAIQTAKESIGACSGRISEWKRQNEGK